MSKGVTINIGVNSLSFDEDSFYKALGNPNFDYLKSSANDALDLAAIANEVGFKIYPFRPVGPYRPLLAENEYHKEVKVSDVLEAIKKFSTKGDSTLKETEFLLISFSGHGMKIPQLTPTDINDVDKVIPAEASWCFYDRPLLDDELVDVLSDFNEGVKIVIISDSCHSGFVIDKSYLGLLGINISGVNLQVLEKAVLKAKGFKFKDLNNSDISELNNTIINLNKPENIKKRKENIEEFQEKMFIERISKPFEEILMKEGLPKNQIDTILENLDIQQINKNLNFSSSNKLLDSSIKNKNNFLKKLSKIKLNDETFEEFKTHLDIILQKDLKVDINKLDQIPLVKNVKLIPTALAEQIYTDNLSTFNQLRSVARTSIEGKKTKLAIGKRLIKAKVIFLSACQDEESTVAGCNENTNSEYTKAILKIWKCENGQRFMGSYANFEEALKKYFKKTSWTNECNETYTQIQTPLVNKNDDSFYNETPIFTL